MFVGVPWNASVTQIENEPISLSISERNGLIGRPAVSSKPLQRLT
jgi:hypothetical protein